MDRRRHFIVLIAVLIIVASASPSPSLSSSKVTVSVYYESLCPYCANFIVNSLVKVFQTDLISIVDLRLIPWGNAWIQLDGSMACQHGPDECFLNTIEACAISLFPDVGRHFKFIDCVERLNLEGRHSEWASCLNEAGLGTSPVDCYNHGSGYTLERNYADETARLNPPHRFVPWIVVNGQALQENFPNFVSYVCKAYRGSQVIDACRSLLLAEDSSKELEFESLVCYNGESSNAALSRH